MGIKLWVDAICIDQANDVEKNAQVRRMDETYRRAAHVSVWLGLPSLPSHGRIPTHLKPVKTFEIDLFDWFDHLEDLANRPYWSRMWVVQECLLPESILVVCGNTKMMWSDFQDMLCRRADIMEREFEDPATQAVSDAIASFRALPLLMARHVDRMPELLQSLHDLLVSHHRAECKDPRDKIFGLLGLVTIEERSLLERFFPDYTMPEDHVRVIALAHVLQYNVLHGAPEVTAQSDELFLGLGLRSGVAERRRLLERARLEVFDYTGDWEPGQASAWLRELDSGHVTGWRSLGEEHDGYNEGAGLMSQSALAADLEARYGVTSNSEHDLRWIWEEVPQHRRRCQFSVGLVLVTAAVGVVCWRYGVLERLWRSLGL